MSIQTRVQTRRLRAILALLTLTVVSAQVPAHSGTSNAPPSTNSHGSSLGATKAELSKLPSAEGLRQTGTINVTAKRAELIKGSSAVYSGDVIMKSDTLNLDGDRLELKQFPNSQFIATLTGAPAHMSHPSSGDDDPPMTARAKTIVYDSHSGIADLVGDAFVTKGEQNITAETIHYNVAENGIVASGGDEGGRVHIVIPPAPPVAPDTSGTPGGDAVPPSHATAPAETPK